MTALSVGLSVTWNSAHGCPVAHLRARLRGSIPFFHAGCAGLVRALDRTAPRLTLGALCASSSALVPSGSRPRELSRRSADDRRAPRRGLSDGARLAKEVGYNCHRPERLSSAKTGRYCRRSPPREAATLDFIQRLLLFRPRCHRRCHTGRLRRDDINAIANSLRSRAGGRCRWRLGYPTTQARPLLREADNICSLCRF